MGCFQKLKDSIVFGGWNWNADHWLTYKADRKVVIRDWRLGLLYRVFVTAIFAYIGMYVAH